MNRSNKGFGLAGVLVTVIFLIVAAIFSASAKSAVLDLSLSQPIESVQSISVVPNSGK